MSKIWIDFETFSRVNIKVAGGYRYCTSESTNIICLGYAFDDEPVQLWTPIMPPPVKLLDRVSKGTPVYAHNALFDWRIWDNIAHRDYGWKKLSPHQVIDTAGLGSAFTLPLSLDQAGRAMNLTMPKDITGKMLIKVLCTPDKEGNQPRPDDSKYSKKFGELGDYCMRDVDAMREFVMLLPRQTMTGNEGRVWRLTQRMNTRGLPVAKDEAVAINDYLVKYIEEAMDEVPFITDGMVQTINQVAKTLAWCKDQGYPLPNMQIATVATALDDESCPPQVRKILRLRQELGKTSTAKYKKIIDQACAGAYNTHWVHDNLIYHGAATGRWTGRGFQMQNLPRASVENPEEVIDQFITGEEMEDPVLMGKSLIRPMIKAPAGWSFLVSDYSSIENRVLHWLASDWEELENFRNGLDQYKTMAAARYRVDYADVTKDQRMLGKVIILGCGYGMGAPTFQKTAKVQFGLSMEEVEAKDAVSAYRDKYQKVVALWDGLKRAAIKTVISGRKNTYGLVTFGSATVNGIRWLASQLPNGKCLYYKNPKVEQRHIPGYEKMGTVPTIMHEGFNSYKRKWDQLVLSPGRITENAVQATAREMMATGLLNIQDGMKEVNLVGTVHDEGLGLIKNCDITDETMQIFNHLLCTIPWAKDCPITAEGYIARRYKK